MTQEERNRRSQSNRMALKCINTIVESLGDNEPGPAVFRVGIHRYIDSHSGLDMVGIGVDFCDGSTIDYFLLRDNLSTITALCSALNIKTHR